MTKVPCVFHQQQIIRGKEQAEADSIVTLQPFRDKCEPVFLFSVNGKIVAKIKGANAPLVSQTIITLINEERKIAADQLYSIAIIKPNAVTARKVQEIKEKIIDAEFVIEAEDKKLLTEEQVRYFYSRIADQPDFEDFVSFMTSGLSYILVVSQGKEKQPSWDESESNSETESKEPWDDHQETAKSSGMKEKRERDSEVLCPFTQGIYNYILDFNSFQECLERQQISQFCDVEENISNTKFIDVFIPDFKKIKGIKLEKILALLRPALFNERKEDVLNIIQDEGFKILMQRQIVLSEEEAKTLCMEYENKDYFRNLIENMTSGPSLALVLVRENGLGHWKQLIGPSTVEEAKGYLPDSLCAQFAMESLPINQLYGSDSLEAAERDIQYFFPPQHTAALIKPHVTQEQRGKYIKIELILYSCQQSKSSESIVVCRGPSLVMILTKWNAVSDWRRLMGPTDPEEARLLSPDSIRAQFGRSILKNAVHGASNVQEAVETINRVFEDFVAENPEKN
eukprot:bmy_07177T0